MAHWKARNELGREFLQSRLALLGKLGFAFLATFLIAFNAVNLLDPEHAPMDWLRNRSNLLHFAAALVMCAVWWSCRDRPRSRRFLLGADALSIWLCSTAFAGAVLFADPEGSRNYAMLLEGTTNLLVLRAVVVPSTTVRTFWVGASVLPLATYAAYRFGARGGEVRADAVRHALESALFCCLAIAASTMTSHVIWILRRRVREALTVGQYTLEAKLGEGGMGVVYRARHSLLRRPTAVKLLPAEKSAESARQRFEREVQLTSQLTHPNTVAIYDYGHTPEGIFYYAMEYLDGVNLESLVDVDGPQPGGRVVHILEQMCASLAEAHDLGLVHRDVKPANVILCERWGKQDVVKIVDFGLVKDLDTEDKVTRETVIAGTPHYMSPEAILNPDRIGPPTDLYAVGAVGYFLLTGRTVFEAPTLVEMLAHHVHSLPSPPSRYAKHLSPDLEALILRCLAKEPEARPVSAMALASELASCRTALEWSESEARAWWQRWRGSRPVAGATGGSSETTVARPLHVDLAGRTVVETTEVL